MTRETFRIVVAAMSMLFSTWAFCRALFLLFANGMAGTELSVVQVTTHPLGTDLWSAIVIAGSLLAMVAFWISGARLFAVSQILLAACFIYVAAFAAVYGFIFSALMFVPHIIVFACSFISTIFGVANRESLIRLHLFEKDAGHD